MDNVGKQHNRVILDKQSWVFDSEINISFSPDIGAVEICTLGPPTTGWLHSHSFPASADCTLACARSMVPSSLTVAGRSQCLKRSFHSVRRRSAGSIRGKSALTSVGQGEDSAATMLLDGRGSILGAAFWPALPIYSGREGSWVERRSFGALGNL